jgi:lipooligosaccharide transport system permease protein
MFFFSGIFFPVGRLGPWVERLAWAFPLTHLVTISRSLLSGTPGGPPLLSLCVVALVAVAAFVLAASLMKRRFMP